MAKSFTNVGSWANSSSDSTPASRFTSASLIIVIAPVSIIDQPTMEITTGLGNGITD